LGTSCIPSEPDIARVLDALGDDLCSRVGQLVVTEQQGLVETYLSRGDRYATSSADLERRYETAAARLKDELTVLGGVGEETVAALSRQPTSRPAEL
jgi:hypothetical protein